MTTKRIHLKSQDEALLLFGQNDEHLRELEKRFHVQFFIRPSAHPSGEGLTLAIRGRTPHIEKAVHALETRRKNGSDPQYRSKSEYEVKPQEEHRKDMIIRSVNGSAIVPKTENQKEYVRTMRDKDMVIGIGPAGTGKTFLAVAFAIAELQAGRFSKIVLTRPVVEAGEKLGFLPGDFYEKVHPYLKPLYDAFYTVVGPDRFRLLRDDDVIEIVPLAYMRGRTLDDALIILDEAQNTTPAQMLMFLTRMGLNSKVIINGDLTQIDLEKSQKSGLIHIEKVLNGVPGIQFVRFTNKDIVRHELVKAIISAYDKYREKLSEPN